MFFMQLLDKLKNIPNDTISISKDRLTFIDTLFKEENIENFLEFYYRLEDKQSQDILLKIIINSIGIFFSSNRNKYNFFTKEEWSELISRASTINCDQNSYKLDIIETFILEGYNYNNICCARIGDVVLDCGAYTGNTALYFANRVGEKGKVYSFEPMSETFNKLQKVTAPYKNITCHNLAISDKPEKICFSTIAHPGSRKQENGIEINATSIDAFVAQNDISRVNFIKMDIEGCEMDGLAGAEKTIRSFNPDLAICIYHKSDDFITIPQKILAYNPNYKLYIKHNSDRFFETVLFAHLPKNSDMEEHAYYLGDKEEKQLITDWWNLFRNTSLNHKNDTKRLQLEAYDLALQNNTNLFQGHLDKTNYNFLYYPLSSDGKLHYEFLYSGNGLEISLHFEGKYQKYINLIDKIIAASELSIPLNKKDGRIKGVFYLYQNLTSYDYIASLMNYLIHISFPLLLNNRLIDDKYILGGGGSPVLSI